MVFDGWYLEHDTLHMGIVPAGKMRRRDVLLYYSGDQVPEFEVLESDSDLLTVSARPESGARAIRLRLALKPGEEGDGEARVEVKTNLSEQRLSILVRWKVKGAP
jgi:hypothetical protein